MKTPKMLVSAVALVAPLFAQAALISSFEGSSIFTAQNGMSSSFVASPGVTEGAQAWRLTGSASSYVLAFQSYSGSIRTALGGNSAAAGSVITIDFTAQDSAPLFGNPPYPYAGLGLQLNGNAGSNIVLAERSVTFGNTGTFSWTLDSTAATFVRNSTSFFGLQFYRNSNLGVEDSIYVDNFTITAVPEPSSFAAIAAVGALGFAASRRRRRVTVA